MFVVHNLTFWDIYKHTDIIKLSVTKHDGSEENELDGQLEKAKNYCNAVMEDFSQVVSR